MKKHIFIKGIDLKPLSTTILSVLRQGLQAWVPSASARETK